MARYPVHVTCRGIMPRCATTGIRSRAMASMMNGLAEQYTELAPISKALNPTRIASSGVARACGVAADRKLFGAAAASNGNLA